MFTLHALFQVESVPLHFKLTLIWPNYFCSCGYKILLLQAFVSFQCMFSHFSLQEVVFERQWSASPLLSILWFPKASLCLSNIFTNVINYNEQWQISTLNNICSFLDWRSLFSILYHRRFIPYCPYQCLFTCPGLSSELTESSGQTVSCRDFWRWTDSRTCRQSLRSLPSDSGSPGSGYRFASWN